MLGQAQWASRLANKALDIDPENSHAMYQRACAHAESGYIDEALQDLEQAINQSETLRLQARDDSSFAAMAEHEQFLMLVSGLAPEE